MELDPYTISTNKLINYMDAVENYTSPKTCQLLSYNYGYSYDVFSEYAGLEDTVERRYLPVMHDIIGVGNNSRFITLITILRYNQNKEDRDKRIIHAVNSLTFAELLTSIYNCRGDRRYGFVEPPIKLPNNYTKTRIYTDDNPKEKSDSDDSVNYQHTEIITLIPLITKKDIGNKIPLITKKDTGNRREGGRKAKYTKKYKHRLNNKEVSSKKNKIKQRIINKSAKKHKVTDNNMKNHKKTYKKHVFNM